MSAPESRSAATWLRIAWNFVQAKLHHGDGYAATVIDGGVSGGEGMVVWLDDRDFGPKGLRTERDE